jgi:hypothetical protein
MANRDPHLAIVDEHSVAIKDKLTISEDLLSLLVADKVVTSDEKDDIKACGGLLYWLHSML